MFIGLFARECIGFENLGIDETLLQKVKEQNDTSSWTVRLENFFATQKEDIGFDLRVASSSLDSIMVPIQNIHEILKC